MEQQDKFKRKLQQQVIIKCPHCGWEYVPGEVFYSDNVTGYPIDIIKDPLGKVIYVEYKEDGEPFAEEDYWCDHCDKPFIATVELKCSSRPKEKILDFSEESVKLW